MKLQLINGLFSPQDAIDLLTKMTHIKVAYHEAQIKTFDHEEDVKSREKRIKELQQSLQEARHAISQSGDRRVSLQAELVLTVK